MIVPRRSRSQRRADEFEALAAVAQAIAAAADLPEVLSAVMDRLSQVLAPAEAGLILLWDAGTGHRRVAAAFSAPPSENSPAAFRPEGTLLQPELGQHQVLRLNSRLAIKRSVAGLEPALRTTLLLAPATDVLPRSLLALPLVVGSASLGVLWLVSLSRPERFTEKDVHFCQRLADLLAVAINRTLRHAPSPMARSGEAADLLRSEVTAALSHELRTPLAAIKGYATALLLDEVNWSIDDHREFLELIERECDNMQMMIGEMLDSALLDAGHLSIEEEPVRLAQLVREVVEEVQHQTTKHRLKIDFPADFPLLDADPRRIRQVMRNILDNAIKYSPEGGLIVIRGEVHPSEVVVSIADQGVGLAPEDLIPLFDKYFRAKLSTTHHVPGTGLGLPISRGIVEAHGGRIWAASRLGHGTTIFFSMPRLDAGLRPPE